MKKNNPTYIKPLIGMFCIGLFAFGLAVLYYDEYVKHPENSSSPTSSGRLFNLLFYLMDKEFGAIGVYSLLGLLFIIFTFWFYQELRDSSR